jgi:hypothetical protein
MTILDTHAVLIAEVEDLLVNDGQKLPLLYVQGTFTALRPEACAGHGADVRSSG